MFVHSVSHKRSVVLFSSSLYIVKYSYCLLHRSTGHGLGSRPLLPETMVVSVLASPALCYVFAAVPFWRRLPYYEL